MTNQERAERCETCRFWQDDSEAQDGYGWCCRHAPRPLTLKEARDDFVFASFPTTAASDWCGEFQPVRNNSDELPDPLPGTGPMLKTTPDYPGLWAGFPDTGDGPTE